MKTVATMAASGTSFLILLFYFIDVLIGYFSQILVLTYLEAQIRVSDSGSA
jgi:hypothetical protein